MKQRQKKKNMVRKISGQNNKLQQLSRALAVVLDENAVLRASYQEMSKQIDYFGTMPIYQPIDNRYCTEIETQEIITKPMPYGMVDQKRPSEILYKQLTDRKHELAVSLAEAMIEAHAIQFIHKPAFNDGPFDQYDTLAGKLYYVPWPRMQAYRGDITEIVLAAKNRKNYALQISEEIKLQPKEWIDWLWQTIQEWR